MKDFVFATLLGGEVQVPKAKAERKQPKAAKAKPVKTAARPAKASTSGDYLVCECCGRKVPYEEGLVRLGGKRICGRCAKARTAKVNVPNPEAID